MCLTKANLQECAQHTVFLEFLHNTVVAARIERLNLSTDLVQSEKSRNQKKTSDVEKESSNAPLDVDESQLIPNGIATCHVITKIPKACG